MDKLESTQTWWGNYELATGQNWLWQIGPLSFIVRYHDCEWQIGHQREEEIEEIMEWQREAVDELPSSLKFKERYIFRQTSGKIKITPKLADRAVISRPIVPLNLVAGEQTTLYVSTPLWVEFAVGESYKIINELGILRPSDTWFGPTSYEGEVCYASNTHCRLDLDDLPQRIHRAVTPVEIHNQADSVLSLERLKIPAPLLSLYVSSDLKMWTPRVSLIREKDGDMAELKIDNAAPSEADNCTLLSKARKTMTSGVLIRAFNAMFG